MLFAVELGTDGLAEGGAVAVLGVGFILILRWVIGNLTSSLRTVEKSINASTAALMSLQTQILAHDLTVSGLNPSAGATFEERDSRAYAKYLELERSIETMRKHVKEIVHHDADV